MNYKSITTLILISFLILLIVSCSSTKEPQTTLPSNIDPNNCRINGTIISIEEIIDPSGPCSTNPCVANVKVNNVIGTGSSFKIPLVKNDTINVKFAFTLSKTSKDLFPNLNKSFPGLKVEDKFIADVEKIEALKLGIKSNQIEYRIFNYDKID